MSDLKIENEHEGYSIFTLNHLCPAARQTREMKNNNPILQRFKILLVSMANLLYYICCVCIPPKPKLLVFTMNDCIIYNIILIKIKRRLFLRKLTSMINECSVKF